MDRRTFLKMTGLAGATALGADVLPSPLGVPAIIRARDTHNKPNILFIMVDQLRYPQWFPDQATLDSLLPSLAGLRQGAVRFGQHYTAANACTPARSCLLTGLYTHQTGCLLTGINSTNTSNGTSRPVDQPLDLNTGFPTWGTALRKVGYKTYWYGKWHLSASCNLEPYGFSGGTCPSPNGGPGQGTFKDPGIAQQFVEWFAQQGTSGPWCTTVSFVNPHDISWYYRITDQVPLEKHPPHVFTQLPPNFETDTALQANKPHLQTAWRNMITTIMGSMPFSGPDYEEPWLKMLDLYLLLQRYVDAQIGKVLTALEAQPDVAKRTIIVFTSDHGEYCGSHGLLGKGGGAYDEAIRVPLYVKDPTGTYTRRPDIERTQLTSSVDVAALLLSLATGGTQWRSNKSYAHISGRADLAAILKNPKAPGRAFVLHTTDEDVYETFERRVQTVPVNHHVIALRTSKAKLVTYSNWNPKSLSIQSNDQEIECYDYSTQRGRMELDNVAPKKPAVYKEDHDTLVKTAIPKELRKPLPRYLQHAQDDGLNLYRKVQASQQ